MNKLTVVLSALGLLMLGACDKEAAAPATASVQETAVEHAMKHADPTYVCPMHPQIVRGEPGSCPICGMDLVLQSPVDGYAEVPEVTVSAGLAFNLGLKTAPVERTTLWKYIETVGRITYDETRMWHMHSRATGWVEKLNVKSVGEPVKAGDVLLEYYSPEVLAAQEEWLQSIDAGSALQARAKERLRLLGVSEALIGQIARERKVRRTISLLAKQDATVTALNLREGMYVTPSLELVTLADLGSLWMLVDVFEHQLNWVKLGNPVEMKVDALPGRVWEGEVEYIYPELDPKTRSLKLRLKFDNADGKLMPNMFADVAVYGGPKRDVLAVPRGAVIQSAEGSRVVKVLPDHKYQPVAVTIGMESKGLVEVLDGLAEGESVVTSAQFMIDSESNLKASLGRFAADAAGHQH